jgi:hypothetical protein
VSISLDGNAKEEAQLAKVFDGKLSAQPLDNVLKESWAGAGEHHVIHIQRGGR